MPCTDTAPPPAQRAMQRSILAGWVSRGDLARELGLTEDTLRRWEGRRVGPSCVRAGRKVLYRRSAIDAWLEAQELPHPTSRPRGRR